MHKMFHTGDIAFAKEKYPYVASFIQNVIRSSDVADEILSTGGMMQYVAQSDKQTFHYWYRGRPGNRAEGIT